MSSATTTLPRKVIICHGMVGSREYSIWKAMKTRCTNRSHKQYKDYGGRGITVCERWASSFIDFYEDMGPCPPGHTIERENNDLGYSLGNCVWLPRSKQNRNRRDNRYLEFRGERLLLVEWAERLGLPPHTIASRLDTLGWSVEKALTTGRLESSAQRRYLTMGDETLCLTEWSRRYGRHPDSVADRLKRGWTLLEALTTPPSRGGRKKRSTAS